MAYKANKNEETLVLAQVKKNERGDYIRASKVVNTETGETVAYDIRNMYTDDAGEIQFTSKGVRVNQEDFIDLLKVILTDMDANTFNNLVEDVTNSDENPD